MKDISKEIQNFKIFKNNKFQISNLKIINLIMFIFSLFDK